VNKALHQAPYIIARASRFALTIEVSRRIEHIHTHIKPQALQFQHNKTAVGFCHTLPPFITIRYDLYLLSEGLLSSSTLATSFEAAGLRDTGCCVEGAAATS